MCYAARISRGQRYNTEGITISHLYILVYNLAHVTHYLSDLVDIAGD